MLLPQLEATLQQNAELQFLVRHLQRLEIETYLAGGAIRDLLLDCTPGDFDLICRPHDVSHLLLALRSLPGHLDTTSAPLGVFTYRAPSGAVFEIALPRLARPSSLSYSTFSVAFSPHLSIQDDLTRRDFNVNAIAYDFARSMLIDPTGGLASIARGQFSALAGRGMREDAVRVLRALILVARHQLQPDIPCFTLLTQVSASLSNLPSHRVRREFLRLLAEPHASLSLRLAHRVGALAILLPELDLFYDFDQRSSHHHESLGEHSLSVLAALVPHTREIPLRLAGLLHDLGKPPTARFVGRHLQFPLHAQVGSKLAHDALLRWDLEPTVIDEVSRLVADHMFALPPNIRTLGSSPHYVRRLLLLRIADEEAKGQDTQVYLDLLAALATPTSRESFAATPSLHLASRVHPWVEHRDRKRRGNWDERANKGKTKPRRSLDVWR